MTFYRPGGAGDRINAQQDTVYVDFVGGATGWMPINKGDNIAVNICRAAITLQTPPLQTFFTASPVAPEVSILMECKMFGSEPDGAARPIDQWQNVIVATSRGAHRAGWVRLRVLNINNGDGTGVVMDLQISRTGESGKVM